MAITIDRDQRDAMYQQIALDLNGLTDLWTEFSDGNNSPWREREAQGLRQDDLALAAGLGLRAVGEIEAGKPTAQFNTWLAVIQALGFKLVVVRKHPRSSP